jgi:hypothetical protein
MLNVVMLNVIVLSALAPTEMKLNFRFKFSVEIFEKNIF